MKKLLTILGAVGLTATTGATVVACGNPDDKATKSDFKVYLNDTEIKKGKKTTLTIQDFDKLGNLESLKVVFDNDKQDIVQVDTSVIKSTIEITALNKEGTVSFHVEATVKSATQPDKTEVKKSDTVSLVVTNKVDITNNEILKSMLVVLPGTPKVGVDALIQSALAAAVHDVVAIKTDYEVSEIKDPVALGDTITISAVKTSEKIKGSFSVKVAKFDIAKLEPAINIVAGDTKDAATTKN